MTTYTLSVDSASVSSTFTDIDLRKITVLPVDAASTTTTFADIIMRKVTVLAVASASVASTFTNVDLRRVFVLPVSTMAVVSVFTDLSDHVHQFFYWMAGAIQKCNVRASYRMGGLIGWNRFADPIYSGAFSAKQSLIIPEDINADDRFGLER